MAMRKAFLAVLVCCFVFVGMAGWASAQGVSVSTGNGKVSVVVTPVQISAPYTPGDTKGGTRPMKAGEHVVMSAGNLGQATGQPTKDGGLLFSFPAPAGDVEVVFNASIDGFRGNGSQWLCLPWGSPFVYQKEAAGHPNNVVVVGAFGIRDGKVVDITNSMGALGFTRTQGGSGKTATLGEQLK